MKKYLLKGKQFFAKKLEELDIDRRDIDYVEEQVPNRLKQALSVLRQSEIDLEDTHQYETYFKTYPNHHLSHFLLDKYQLLDEASSDPPQYKLPNSKHQFIPAFDQNLEKKALLFKEAIDQYDEGYGKVDEPILCMCVIHFHHKRGTEVQYRFPDNKTVSALQDLIVHHAMPDSSHNKNEDYNYYNFESQIHGKKRMLFGVSYFKQIKLTQQMKKDNTDLTRSYVQKAVAVVSTIPIFGYLKMKLAVTTKVFFEQFTNFDIIQMAYKEINTHLAETWPEMGIQDLYIGSDLRNIIHLFEAPAYYEIWKAVLYQRRIVIFAHSPSSASSFIASLISLFPGLNTFGMFSKPIAKYMQGLRQYALPLRLFSSSNFLSMSFHIQDFHLLTPFNKSQVGNFLLGTTNRLLKQSNDYGIELLVNLQNCTIEKRKSRKPWQSLSKKEKTFISELQEMVGKQGKNETSKQSYFAHNEDCIRNHFHNFLKAALVEMSRSIKLFRNFVKDCEQYSKNEKQSHVQGAKSSSYQVIEDQIEIEEQRSSQFKLKNEFPPIFPSQISHMILPELLLNKSFSYFLQFHNESLAEVCTGKIYPSLYINDFNYCLRINEEEFITYNWLEKKLTFGKGQNSKNFDGKEIKFAKGTNKLSDTSEKEEVKYIYIGMVSDGKFSKFGFYVDENEHYEGQYCEGVKQGYGKYKTDYEKYIGYFKSNMYEGQGQLIVGSDIYVGEFREGLRNGYGSNQGSFEFVGEWKNDQPIITVLSQQQKTESTDSLTSSSNKPEQLLTQQARNTNKETSNSMKEGQQTNTESNKDSQGIQAAQQQSQT